MQQHFIQRSRAYMAIVPAMIFFSLSFVWFKVANVSYGPLTIILFRLALSSFCLLIFNVLSRRLLLPRRGEWGLIVLVGLFEPFLYFMFESYGLQLLSSTVGAVIISTIPLVSPLAAYLFLGERVKGKHVICVVISLVGVGLVVLQPGTETSASLLGVLLMFGAVSSGVGYSVVLHKIPRRLNTLSILMYQNMVGALCFAPLWRVFEYRRFVDTPADMGGLMAILKLSLVVSTLAYMFFSYSVRRLGVNRANMFINLIPVFTAVFAWFILGESLTVQKMLGIVVTVAGLFLAARLHDGLGPASVPSA